MTTTPTNKTIYCPRLHFLYFSKDKELVVISNSTSWICSLASLIYQLFICFSCNFLHFLPNHSSFPPYSHQHIPEVLKISHFLLPSVCLTNFFRDRSKSGSSSEAASSTTKPDEGEKSHHLRGCRGMAGHQSQKWRTHQRCWGEDLLKSKFQRVE